MGKRGTTEWITPAEFQALAAKSATPATVRGKSILKDVDPEITPVEGQPQRIRFRITSGAVDRDRDIIEPSGVDYSHYMAHNPTVLWAHQYDDLPVGHTVEMTREAGGWYAVCDFTPREIYPFADTVRQMVLRRDLNMCSIGFRPMEWVYNEERRGIDFSKIEGLEWSICPVGSNPDAYAEARAAGVDIAPLVEWAEKTLERAHGEPGLWIPKQHAEAIIKIFGEHKLISIPAPVEIKPYPNEHACRLRDPGDFQSDSFRRTTRDHEGRAYSVIMGRLTGETTMTEQAYRYSKDSWAASEARSHCRSHEGSFEAASGEASICQSCREEAEKGFAPAALPLKGTYQWISQQLSASSEEYMRRMQNVQIRQQDWTMVAATWPEKALIAVIGPERPWDEDLAYQVGWSMREGMPAWSGEPQEIDMQVQVELRPVMRTVKRGRVLSSTNEGKLRQAKGYIDEVLAQLETAPETEGLEITEQRSADLVLEITEPAEEELRIEASNNGHKTVEITNETITLVVRESLAGLMPGIAREVQRETQAAINRARGRVD